MYCLLNYKKILKSNLLKDFYLSSVSYNENFNTKLIKKVFYIIYILLKENTIFPNET
jgi:hypothetical protein